MIVCLRREALADELFVAVGTDTGLILPAPLSPLLRFEFIANSSAVYTNEEETYIIGYRCDILMLYKRKWSSSGVSLR